MTDGASLVLSGYFKFKKKNYFWGCIRRNPSIRFLKQHIFSDQTMPKFGSIHGNWSEIKDLL
jgi:pectate lyase